MIKLILALTLCFSAYAFTPLARWENTPISYQVDGPWKLKAATEKAIGKWTVAASGEIEFCNESEPAVTIKWIKRGWEYPPSFAAVTVFNTLDGFIVSATVSINAESYRWRRHSREMHCKRQYENLDVTILHELGHVLGLGHSDQKDSVMYFAPTENALSSDDIQGIQFLYGGA